jgi:hypothetical protein
MMGSPCDRRKFVKTSAGFLAFAVTAGVFHVEPEASQEKHYEFRPYRSGRTLAPVECITPDDGFYLHTFYDICPWSTSQRYFAVTRFAYQQKKPEWGDTAEVCVIDLERRTIKTVYRTKAWGFQLGANLEWSHHSDRYLYTNDIIAGHAVCVRLDLEEGTAKAYAGAKYNLAPDDLSVISPYLMNMNQTQYGYSVPDPPSGRPVPFTRSDMASQGLWRTDLVKNRRSLWVPFSRFVRHAGADSAFYSSAILYLFHSKFNRQNTRVLQVLRGQVGDKGRNASLFSVGTDGTGLVQCLSREHWNHKARMGGSGNHPNWHPDGEHVIMNCVPVWLGYQDMMFCKFRYDGTGFGVLSEKHLGSGHPSVEVTGRYLIADAYPKQKWVVGPDGEMPLRLLDLKTDEERVVCRIANDVGGHGEQYTKTSRLQGGSEFKLDPHPTWSRDYSKVAFNGAPAGRRQVFVADLASLMHKS